MAAQSAYDNVRSPIPSSEKVWRLRDAKMRLPGTPPLRCLPYVVSTGMLSVMLATVGCRDASSGPAVAANSEAGAAAGEPENNQTAAAADSTENDQPAQTDDKPPAALWPPGTLSLTFKDVEFDIKKGGDFEDTMLTGKIRALHGRRIKIGGFMLSSFKEDGLSEFVILQNSECPFGGPEALVYHNMMVNLQDGETTSFTLDPITIEGTLSLRPFPPDRSEKELSIYNITNATLK